MVDRTTVQHIARLARIELSATEEQTLERDLSSILAFVEKLAEVDTSSVEPVRGGTTIENVFRPDDDTAGLWKSDPTLLVDGPSKKQDGRFEVKAIFER